MVDEEIKPLGPKFASGSSATSFKHPHMDEGQMCCVCGKSAAKSKNFVFLSDVSEPLGPEDREKILASATDCIGEWPVGADCARKLRKAGVHVFKR